MAGGGEQRNVAKLKVVGAADDRGSRADQRAERKYDDPMMNLLIGDAAKLARSTERYGGPPQAHALAALAEAVSRGDTAGAARQRDIIRSSFQNARKKWWSGSPGGIIIVTGTVAVIYLLTQVNPSAAGVALLVVFILGIILS